MTSKIYIDDLGFRDCIKDSEQIIWFIEQKGNLRKSESAKSSYWNNCLDSYEKILIQCEAFEVLNYLKSKTNHKKRSKRHRDKIMRDIKQKIEIEELIDNLAKRRNINKIISNGYSLN